VWQRFLGQEGDCHTKSLIPESSNGLAVDPTAFQVVSLGVRVTFTRVAVEDSGVFIPPPLKPGELILIQDSEEWCVLGCPQCTRPIRVDAKALAGERVINCAERCCPAEFVILDWEIVDGW